MKLIYCPVCTDIVRLFEDERFCKCRASWGNYVDSINAKIGGEAIPFGISNATLANALQINAAGITDESIYFQIFIIPINCTTIIKE